ncbi:MAG: RsmE family RNA methyltransferase [bacterium]
MQLFITEYSKKNDTIIVNDTELLAQLRKVLRARIGDHIWIQSPQDEKTKIRYEISITLWDNKMFEGTIVHEQQHTLGNEKTTMLVAMPNKWDKVELIVQKLTECGLDQIVFWPSERSIIRTWNPKKEERLQKIIQEAVEQSRGRKLPKLVFATDITKYIQDPEIIIFDKPGISNKDPETRNLLPSPKSHIAAIV